MKRNIIALLCGVLFSSGLVLSGMTDRFKVLAFLDLFGAWDPTLLFVMISALSISLPGFYWVKQKQKPIFDSKFFLPERQTIDKRILIGAALFGVGWGLYGLCPGPAIASLTYGQFHSIVFTVAMIVGLGLAKKLALKIPIANP